MYEQNNENIGGENGTPPSDVQNTEYSFSKENLPHRSYMDANYVPQSEGPAAPRSYYTPPVKPPKIIKEKKPGEGIAKLIIACLICALLGGIGGGALVATQIPKATVTTNYGGSNLNISDSDSTQTQTASPVSSGEKLTGAQIYSLGCTQAVGISTDITYTNYFGAQSTAAVSGSGFIVTGDGYIVTNYHVIADAYTSDYKVSVILYNGDKFEAKIVGVEESSDIAVLKIDATGLSAATLGNSDNMQVGENVYAVGNPLGELSFSMTSGMISALDRDITTQDSTNGQTTTNNMFQIDAAVNEGNSGGPAYNDYGEVIGIVTAKYSDTGVEGLGFAIPINDVATIVDELINNGYVTGKANFGITVTTVDSTVAQYYNMVEGAYVYSVASGSCSDKAGLRVGDIITAINDVEVKSSSELTNEKKNFKAGDSVTLKVYRQPDDNSKKGEYVDIKITLDEDIPTNATPSADTKKDADESTTNDENSTLPTIPKF